MTEQHQLIIWDVFNWSICSWELYYETSQRKSLTLVIVNLIFFLLCRTYMHARLKIIHYYAMSGQIFLLVVKPYLYLRLFLLSNLNNLGPLTKWMNGQGKLNRDPNCWDINSLSKLVGFVALLLCLMCIFLGVSVNVSS